MHPRDYSLGTGAWLVTVSHPRYNQGMFGRDRSRGALAVLAGALVLAALSVSAPTGAQDERPELRLRARPEVSFAPSEISFVGLLRGGPDDHEDFYCLSAEWDWDDGTRSESIFDCEPYEPGVSEIRRRFSRRHTYDRGGRYEVRLSLKRRDDVVDSVRTSIVVQGGG